MEPSSTELARQSRTNKVIDPNPGQCSQGDFEGTGPISPQMKRVGPNPALELRLNFIWVPCVTRQQPGLRQNDQVLMAVQFPDHFVVAGARSVQVGDEAKISETGFNAAHIVA